MNATRLAAILTTTLLPSLALAADYQGNLVLASQSDVDAASVYTGVTGNLTISGTDIVDLGPLAGFTQVGGYIQMDGNPSLTQAIGVFPSLTNVGGGMFFYNNDSLLELSGFDALLQTGDNIDFWYNDVLVSVSGFAALQTAGWSLEFGGNPNLVEIPEFSSLQTISSSLFILDNDSLEAISGFQALQFVSWSFQIQGNPNLNELCGLYDYFTVNNPYTGGGAFDIKDNGPGLPNPTSEQDVVDAGPCTSGTPFCFGDGSGTPCPCGNSGAPGEGCANSTGSGAILGRGGSDSVGADDITFTLTQGPAGVPGIVFTGTLMENGGNGSLFGDGLLCASGTIQRLNVEFLDGAGAATWGPGLQTLGGWLPGDTRYVQGWYRNTLGSPCAGDFNTSHALAVSFQP